MTDYDLIIIGAGPAGLSAAIYAARYKISMLVLTRDVGGLAATAHKICNFLSYDEITGLELMQKARQQAETLGVKIEYVDVNGIEANAEGFVVKSLDRQYTAKKIIFTGGTVHEKLNIPGEEEFLGKGVSYCATCDGGFFKGKNVAVIGGSDAALTAALLLSEYAAKVYIIYRQSSFIRPEPAWVELVEKDPKIVRMFNEEVVAIKGGKRLESLELKSGKVLKLDGAFVEIGSKPSLEMLGKLNIAKDKNYIVVNQKQQTNIPGFYAAGDVTNSELKQIVTAAAQGAVAAYQVYNELKREKS